jgi:peptide/nickel transport system substrate-binding protein
MRQTRVGAFVVLAILMLITACGGEATNRGGSTPDATATPTTQPALPATSPGTDPQPSGELRIASGFLPATLDPNTDGYSLITRGVAETLTRITPDQRIEPWLAESLERVDERTWRVTLRENATFWDGSPVDANAVKESFERSLAEIPAAPRFLDPEAEIIIFDYWTIELRLPEPTADLPNNLATFQFAIAKRSGERMLMTGPYEPERLIPDAELHLKAYAGHWTGSPPIARIHIRMVTDANARLLALQSGEVDLVTEVPPELATDLGRDIEVVITASTRIHHVILNHARPPFNDPAVREAVALGIDRDLLNDLTMGGLGTVTTTIFPPGLNIPTIEMWDTDRERAAQLLDDAGWVPGSDGVRIKDGQRLQFLLYSYPARPEITLIAISMQDQLRDLGFDVQVQQIESIVPQLETLDFDASMFSVNMLPIGDPRYAFNVTVISEATYNYGGYSNTELDQIIEDLQIEVDVAQRERMILRAQEILRDDAVNIYIAAAPRIAAYRTDRVNPFDLHPNDLYGVDRTITLVD